MDDNIKSSVPLSEADQERRELERRLETPNLALRLSETLVSDLLEMSSLLKKDFKKLEIEEDDDQSVQKLKARVQTFNAVQKFYRDISSKPSFFLQLLYFASEQDKKILLDTMENASKYKALAKQGRMV